MLLPDGDRASADNDAVGSGKCFPSHINDGISDKRSEHTRTNLNNSAVSYSPNVSLDLWRSARTKYRPSARKAYPKTLTSAAEHLL